MQLIASFVSRECTRMEAALHLQVIVLSVLQAHTNLGMVDPFVFCVQREHFRVELGRDPWTTVAFVQKENFSRTKAYRRRQRVPHVFLALTRLGSDRFPYLTALFAAQGNCKQVME